MTMVRRQAQHRGEEGFTLLEIMVGLMISALILLGLGEAVAVTNRGFDGTTRTIERQAALTTGLGVVADDLARIERAIDRSAKPARFLFTGTGRQMVFVLSERPGNNRAGVYWVRYQVREAASGRELVRERAPFGSPRDDPAALDWADAVVLLQGSMDIAFSYRAPRAALRQWAGSWEAHNMLPGQVKIEVTDTATGRLRVPVFVAALKITAEVACTEADSPGCTMASEGALVADKQP
jgi:prepilin-type N-terminal cleavage/methylation domain-containing protein